MGERQPETELELTLILTFEFDVEGASASGFETGFESEADGLDIVSEMLWALGR